MSKPAPSFWWDMVHPPGNPTYILVQSDYPGGEALARFDAPTAQPKEEGLEPQIAQAEALIADFQAGRKTPQWATPSKR